MRRNQGVFAGIKFWCGCVDLQKEQITEVHTFEEAESSDYHTDFYFSDEGIRSMDERESAFFWVEDGRVIVSLQEENAAVEEKAIKAINGQIDIISSSN